MANKRFRYSSIAAIAVSGIALSILVSISSYHKDEKFRQQQFNNAVENRYLALRKELDLNLHVLELVQTLFLSTHDLQRSERLDRVEFRAFASNVLKDHPNIQALEWIPRVPDSERTLYESAARKDGFPDFQFTEPVSPGKMRRAEQRKEYFPIYFMEPSLDNTDLGFDLASDPARWTVMERAAKSDKHIATGRITLPGETGNQFGFSIFTPVYQKGVLTSTDQARRDNLEGFMLSKFRISDIVEAATGLLEPEGVDFSINDVSASAEERFLYLHESRLGNSPLLNSEQSEVGFTKTKTLGFAGRQWTISYSATPDFIAARNSFPPWGFFLVGFAITGLVTGFLFVSGRHAEQSEKSANDLSNTNAKLTQEMLEHQQTEDQLRVKEHLLSESQRLGHIGSFLYDMTGPIQWSDELYRLYGVSPDTFTPTLESLISLILPADRTLMQDWTAACVAGEMPAALVFRINWPDGRVRFVRGWGDAVYNDENRVIYIAGMVQDITEHKHAEEELQRYSAELEKKNQELQEALARVKQLTGMLPICAYCKRIKDDQGRWSGVETYVSKHTDAVFSHGLCPDCEKTAREDLAQLIRENS